MALLSSALDLSLSTLTLWFGSHLSCAFRINVHAYEIACVHRLSSMFTARVSTFANYASK